MLPVVDLPERKHQTPPITSEQLVARVQNLYSERIGSPEPVPLYNREGRPVSPETAIPAQTTSPFPVEPAELSQFSTSTKKNDMFPFIARRSMSPIARSVKLLQPEYQPTYRDRKPHQINDTSSEASEEHRLMKPTWVSTLQQIQAYELSDGNVEALDLKSLPNITSSKCLFVVCASWSVLGMR